MFAENGMQQCEGRLLIGASWDLWLLIIRFLDPLLLILYRLRMYLFSAFRVKAEVPTECWYFWFWNAFVASSITLDFGSPEKLKVSETKISQFISRNNLMALILIC